MSSKFWGRYLPLCLSAVMTLLLFQNCGKSFQTIEVGPSTAVFQSTQPEGLDLSHGKVFLITRKSSGAVRNVLDAEVYLDFNTINTRRSDPLCWGYSHLTYNTRNALETHIYDLEDAQSQVSAEIAARAAGSDFQVLIIAESNVTFNPSTLPAGTQLLVGSASAAKTMIESFVTNPESVVCQ
ncbi:MAG: hypothetical protein KF681_16095 [Bdellovibrionaceae bacterium]|nr:hypothetical protein [Pseudobdellovibrionaceae bacterium]